MLKVENTNDYIYLYRLSIGMLPGRKGWLSIANDTKNTSEYELILGKDFFHEVLRSHHRRHRGRKRNVKLFVGLPTGKSL